MPRYVTTVDRWISHECRLVKAGEEFVTEFPKGMKLSDTLRLVEEAPATSKKQGKGQAADDLV